MDINEPKSRSFNMYLRYLQMGLQVFIASKISEVSSEGCIDNFHKVGDIVLYIVIGINLLAILITRCVQGFPRPLFYIVFIIDLILAVILVVLALVGLFQFNTCANNKVLYRFAIVEVAIAVVMAFMVILLSFHWIQRYSNTPGNIVWIFLFFGFGWTATYNVSMIVLGVICAVISFSSLAVNLLACKGITTSMKKIIVVQWVFSLILMLVAEVLAIVVYLKKDHNDVFADNIAYKLLQTFICVNLLDMLFWLWGYLTLEYENGDKIRDELMKGKNDREDESEDVEPY
jgi:hypothetical protein